MKKLIILSALLITSMATIFAMDPVANALNTEAQRNEAARLYKKKGRAWKSFLKTAGFTEAQYETWQSGGTPPKKGSGKKPPVQKKQPQKQQPIYNKNIEDGIVKAVEGLEAVKQAAQGGPYEAQIENRFNQAISG